MERITNHREDRNANRLICLLLPTSIEHVHNATLSSEESIAECVSALLVSLLSSKCAARRSMGPGPVRDTVSSCRDPLRTPVGEHPESAHPRAVLSFKPFSRAVPGILTPYGGSSRISRCIYQFNGIPKTADFKRSDRSSNHPSGGRNPLRLEGETPRRQRTDTHTRRQMTFVLETEAPLSHYSQTQTAAKIIVFPATQT